MAFVRALLVDVSEDRARHFTTMLMEGFNATEVHGPVSKRDALRLLQTQTFDRVCVAGIVCSAKMAEEYCAA